MRNGKQKYIHCIRVRVGRLGLEVDVFTPLFTVVMMMVPQHHGVICLGVASGWIDDGQNVAILIKASSTSLSLSTIRFLVSLVSARVLTFRCRVSSAMEITLDFRAVSRAPRFRWLD